MWGSRGKKFDKMEVLRAHGADRMALGDAAVTPSFPQSASASLRSDVSAQTLLSRDQRIRESALLCFSDSYSHSFVHTITAKEWRKFLHWLDVSGLALYFLDRLTQVGRRGSLPISVLNRLERSLEENRQRTQGLIEESARLQQDFQAVGISYAVMKGVSLYPTSVPRPELRHQFDLDFLIGDSDAPVARRILERHGYTLFAISGRSWEFKKGQTPRVTARDLYRDLPYRGVELHLETGTAGVPTRLQRTVSREIHNVIMPVLSPVDLFLGQAIHASKDISGPFLRASHLLEFYRHVLARHDDACFWEDLRLRANEDRRACLAIGIVTYLGTSVWGNFAPRALTSWTVEHLPLAIQLWLDLYGRAATYQAPPGTKRYLRLRQEMEIASGASHGSSQPSLLSFSLPRAVVQAAPGEALSMRVARYRVQVRFLVSRMRFHFVEGARFIVESRSWRRLRSNLP
jgi:hypothetical protein